MYWLWKFKLWLFKIALGNVCQNCEFGNNKKGVWKHTWKRKKIDNRGFWHVYCEIRNKLYPWDYRKRCFVEKRYDFIYRKKEDEVDYEQCEKCKYHTHIWLFCDKGNARRPLKGTICSDYKSREAD